MNKINSDVLKMMIDNGFVSQRKLSEQTGYSLGAVNLAFKELLKEGCISEDGVVTPKTKRLIEKHKVKNAILLAAGPGMRMVPINLTTPKPLLQIHGECLIERLINQLHEAGIKDITVVVGYRMDDFEYLIDEYGVELVCNDEYAVKNNLKSLALVADKISETYIVPCDLWCRENPFRDTEFYSWYMVGDEMKKGSGVRINRKRELVAADEKEAGNRMIGLSYISGKNAAVIKKRLKEYSGNSDNDNKYWEIVLAEKTPEPFYAELVHKDEVVELNTYEELRELDAGSNQLQSDALDTIARVLSCGVGDITDIRVLKKGMTNRSFLFSAKGQQYIMRIPGEGTDLLVDRKREAAVYEAIRGKGICDDVVYIDPTHGYKITKYLNNIRSADPNSEQDLKRCMKKLREFHALKLDVKFTFDIFKQIEYYESLRGEQPSIYRDYLKTKENVLSLKYYIQRYKAPSVLAHIDSVPDNFLFYKDKNGREQLQLTDWEYAGMQDPHVDIAMFSIYSLYDREKIDRLIDIYFEDKCPEETRIKIYCYIAACGLLWSNWCEFKRGLGVEFGEYSLRQYRYAKDFYKLAKDEAKSKGIEL